MLAWYFPFILILLLIFAFLFFILQSACQISQFSNFYGNRELLIHKQKFAAQSTATPLPLKQPIAKGWKEDYRPPGGIAERPKKPGFILGNCWAAWIFGGYSLLSGGMDRLAFLERDTHAAVPVVVPPSIGPIQVALGIYSTLGTLPDVGASTVSAAILGDKIPWGASMPARRLSFFQGDAHAAAGSVKESFQVAVGGDRLKKRCLCPSGVDVMGADDAAWPNQWQ